MEILIAAVVLAVGLVAAASLLTRRAPGFAAGPARAKAAPVAAPAAAPVAPPVPALVGKPQGVIATTEDGKSAERRADLLRLEERLRAREEAVESRLAELGERERLLADKAGELDVRARAPRARARARRRDAGLAGAQPAAQGGRGPDPPRPRADPAPGRGGDQARRRPARAQHPLGGHAAPRGRPRGGDDGLGRAALRGRHEGPHHRPRGPQHPRARAPDRRRLHHRRHARTR